MADQYESIIDQVEAKYKCIIIYFTTDSDSGSKEGRQLLEIRRPWLLSPSCWAHQVRVKSWQLGSPGLTDLKFQLVLGDYFWVYIFAANIAESATDLIGWINNHGKVRKMFDAAQSQISVDRTGQSVIRGLSFRKSHVMDNPLHCIY
jgi:hypothetical protein